MQFASEVQQRDGSWWVELRLDGAPMSSHGPFQDRDAAEDAAVQYGAIGRALFASEHRGGRVPVRKASRYG